MRTYSAAAIEALATGNNIVSGAIKVASTPPFRAWGGYGTLSLGGEDYIGVGDRGLVSVSAAALGDSAQNIELMLSGVDPDTVALLDATTIQRVGVVIWRLIFDGAGATLLDAQVYARGRLDNLGVTETVGGTSTIKVSVETAARGLGRSGQRMRSDADQRLIDPADAGFKAVSYAGVKTLYWGGKPPGAAGAALAGYGGGGGGFDNNYREL